MKSGLRFLLAIVLLSAMALVPVLAQETTPEAALEATAEATSAIPTGSVTCDADLIMNLYIAERYFGFGAVSDQLRQTGWPGAINTSIYNYSQYAPLYTDMLGLRQSETMSPNGAMSGDWVNSIIMLLPLDDASFAAQMNSIEPAGASPAVPLNPATVAGEAPECAQLRSALYRFWQAVAFMDASTGMNVSVIGRGDVGGPIPAEGTPEATPGM